MANCPVRMTLPKWRNRYKRQCPRRGAPPWARGKTPAAPRELYGPPAGRPSNPDANSVAQRRRQFRGHVPAHFVRMVARTEVAAHDQLVAELVGPLQEVVQVHVAELVDLFAAVVGADEAHLA